MDNVNNDTEEPASRRSVPRSGSDSAYEWLQQRNLTLQSENSKLKSRIVELEEWKDSAHNTDNGSILKENEDLQIEIDKLKRKLQREPVYNDVLQELSKAKMELALMHMEYGYPENDEGKN